MKQTVLYPEHQALGASFTDFGGWDMPVRYGSDLAEHHAVRNSAGLFDISHMAEIRVSGTQSAEFLDFALVNPSSEIAISKAKYSLICATDGGVIDDLIVYRLGETEFLIVANAGNRHNVMKALNSRVTGFDDLEVSDESDDWALIALQGPKSESILQPLTQVALAEVRYYSITAGNIGGIEVLIGRTGYTGEDGFEIFTPAHQAREMWQLLMKAGGDQLMACGLASRDTLRLEAGMPLYGQELDLEHNPYEAGLGKVVRLDRDVDFVGKSALAAQAQQNPTHRLTALQGEGKRAARHNYEIFAVGSDESIGVVTSGALSPTLGYPIAMAYLNGNAELEVGTVVEADIRGTRAPFTIVSTPFYKRKK
jgi:aminomethyltransferase